jgi:magnesium-transporting ATPase (P-type)
LAVGDIVEFQKGETIAADGWLIDGFDIAIREKYLSDYV